MTFTKWPDSPYSLIRSYTIVRYCW